MELDARHLAARLVDGICARAPERALVDALSRFGTDALHCALSGGVRVVPLPRGALYRELSRALARLGIDVDAWPAPPAGLFVVEERTVYLRSRSPMTIAHEFGHALDCVLGGGVYRSGIDPVVRGAFAAARSFVTPYAATGLDEYFAEALRAYVEVNDAASAWPPATRARLQRIDPPLHAYVDDLFTFGFKQSSAA
ncbi:MAG TPA: hypothetical protein VIN40_01125 [Candidatus Tyrphobacter sp.]